MEPPVAGCVELEPQLPSGVAVASASHAWAEAYIPPYGWLGVDATLGTPCTGRHVKLGVGRDYADVAVLRGTYQGGGHAELAVEVTCESLGGLGPAPHLRVEDSAFLSPVGSRREGRLE